VLLLQAMDVFHVLKDALIKCLCIEVVCIFYVDIDNGKDLTNNKMRRLEGVAAHYSSYL
jgi:hypothetical protein